MSETETRPTSRALVIEDLQSEIRYSERELAKFVAKFEGDPLYAFEWAGRYIQCAAQMVLSKEVLEALTREENPASLSQVRATLHSIAWRQARDPSRSTSPLANEVAAEKGSAAARIHERLGHLKEEYFDVPLPPPEPRPAPAAVTGRLPRVSRPSLTK